MWQRWRLRRRLDRNGLLRATFKPCLECGTEVLCLVGGPPPRSCAEHNHPGPR